MIRKTIYIITFLFVLLAGAAKAQDRASEQMDSLSQVIKNLLVQRKFSEAIPYGNELEKLAAETNDLYWLALGDYYQGTIWSGMGRYEEALPFLLRAESRYLLMQQNQRSLSLGVRIYNSLGGCYCCGKMLPEYYQSIQKAMELNQQLGDESLGRVLKMNYVATISHLDSFALANSMYGELLCDSALARENAYIIHLNMAQNYLRMHEYDSSLKYYAIAERHMKSANDTLEVMSARAEIYNNMGSYRECIQQCRRSLEILKHDDNEELASHALNQMAYAYHKLSANDTALLLVDEGIARAKRSPSLWYEVEGMSMKNAILYDLGRYKESSENHVATNALLDSLQKMERKNMLSQLHLQQQLKEVEMQQRHEAELSKIVRSKQKTRYYFALFGLVALVLIVLLLLSRKNILLKEKRIQEQMLLEEIDYKNSELTSKVLSQIKSNELLEEVIKYLEKAQYSTTKQLLASEAIRKLKVLIKTNSEQDFDYYFMRVNPGFYEKLCADFPNLTQSELRLCAFLKLNLNTKEIAAINNITINSAKVARSRLRKKLNISDINDSLVDFLSQY